MTNGGAIVHQNSADGAKFSIYLFITIVLALAIAVGPVCRTRVHLAPLISNFEFFKIVGDGGAGVHQSSAAAVNRYRNAKP